MVRPITEAAPSTDIDLLQGVERQLQQYAVTCKVTPTSDACYTCGGSGHRSRECAIRPHSHAIVVMGSGIICLNVQTACVAHHHGNDLAVRGVPSCHYSVYGDTFLRDPLGVTTGQTNVVRQAASGVATVDVRGDRG